MLESPRHFCAVFAPCISDSDQLHHPRLGQSGDGEDPPADLRIGKFEAIVIVLGMIALTSAISTLSGLWGVLVTDMFQFVIKMSMVIILAVFAINAVGGIEAMKTKLADAGRGDALDIVPAVGSAWMPMIAFFVYIGVNWWATWYPGAEPGGGGYIAQRMFSAKDERHSLLATLWFNIAHYAIRPWPWILVALASLILYPGSRTQRPATSA